MATQATFAPPIAILTTSRHRGLVQPAIIRHSHVIRTVNRATFRKQSSHAFACQTSETSNGRRELSPQAKELRSLLKKCPLYFVGCMGSGKSVVARYVAVQIGYRFLDTDELIELVAKQSIPEIFNSSGEEAFRDLESAVLDQVQAMTGSCIATGGGAVVRTTNWGPMQTGIVVWLNAPPRVLAKRLHEDSTRPLLAGHDSLEAREQRLSELLSERKAKYSQADVTVCVGEDDGVDDIGLEVMRKVANFIKENPPRFAKASDASRLLDC